MDTLKIDSDSSNKRLDGLVINSKPRILKLLKVLNESEKNKSSIRISHICKILDIDISELTQLFLEEEIDIKDIRPNRKINSKKFKNLVEKIGGIRAEELSQIIYDKQLCELIINSKPLLVILDSDADYIRLSKFSAILNIGHQHICKLLELENIVIESNPNSKISCDLLRHLLLKEPEISFPITNIDTLFGVKTVTNAQAITVKEKLADLDSKIQNSENKDQTKSVVLKQFVRNEYIREYAKVRASGNCELCEKPAPFIDIYGNPFLESHHVLFLSKGGKDTIDNVVALCPNCHKKMHNLNLDSDVSALLSKLKNYLNPVNSSINI